MANKKLNSITFPNMPNDRYYLDADKVNYDPEATYRDGSTGKALQHKAEIDGYYSEMSVGDAEQLISSMYVEDSEPYNYRTTGGSADVGNREYIDAIVGGTIAWNQLIATVNKTQDVTPTETNWQLRNIQSSIFTAGHVYLSSLKATVPTNGEWRVRYPSVSISSYTTSAQTIFKYSAEEPNKFSIQTLETQGTDAFSFDNIMVFDLTQMFGSTIADYIYSLEQANAGAGVAFFKKLFPKDYYPYDAGTLKSVEGVSAHEMVGFNQWDEEWEVGGYNNTTGEKTATTNQIRSKNAFNVVSGATYYFKAPSNGSALYFDANGNYIGYTFDLFANQTFTVPNGMASMRFKMATAYGTTYNHDICINLSWSGWRNGDYEPYEKRSYPLDSSKVMRGIFKLDAQNKLYADGDIYPPSGEFQRRYTIVDLGTLNWDYGGLYATAPLPTNAVYYDSQWVVPSGICSKYESQAMFYVINPDSGIDKSISWSNNIIRLRDSAYTTSAEYQSGLSGVYLVYELATPTTEEATPYNDVQICNDFGTEEFVSTGIVPVGHQTRYPANLRDKLQHLPDLADNDGYYMIGQSNKQMHLELFRIPKAPTTDGTYTLQATVSGGTPTYTWVDPNAESEVTNG